ncbi:MAG: DUF4203 domain-containing protein [Lentisphaerales bacterium]|nr:DUF4203 domain-containing protein [Lentisphaerales bacterium]
MDNVIASSGLFVIMISSLIFCFFGYRFFKLLLGLAGAIIVGSLTWAGFQHFAPQLQIPAIITSLIMAAIGAWLFHKAFKLAAFIYGSAAGVALSPAILPYLNIQERWIHWLVPIICGLIGGLLLLISKKFILKVMTSATGAIYFSMALFLTLIQFNIFEETVLDKPNSFHASMWLLSFSLCFFCGLFCQIQDKAAEK